jgi:hypothetical protein
VRFAAGACLQRLYGLFYVFLEVDIRKDGDRPALLSELDGVRKQFSRDAVADVL